MSNRLLGILILIGFIGLAGLFYWYLFVSHTATIIVRSNQAPFSFTMFSIKVPQALEFSCETTECTYRDIPPFSYTLTANRQGYKSIQREIVLLPSRTESIDINFEKEVLLEPTQQQVSGTGIIQNLTQDQKIILLKRKKLAYAFFEIPSVGYFEFTKSGENIELTVSKEINESPKILGTFDGVPKEQISLSQVYGKNGYIFISLGEKRYIIDTENKQIFPFVLKPNIAYIKTGENPLEFLIVTQVGTYIFDTKSELPKYFSQFFDFVYSPDKKTILGLVSRNDEVRKNNFGITENTNVIVGFERETLEKKILLKIERQISKIYESGTGILVETQDGEQFRLTF